MGGKTTSTTQSVQIPKEVMDRYNAVNARAEEAAKQPYQAYGGQFVAGLTGQQRAGMQGVDAAAGIAQPYYKSAADMTREGSQSVGPLTREQIREYESPYTESVVDATRRALEQQQGQERSIQQAQAIRSGGFGGDRVGLERANLARQQTLGMSQAISPLYQQGYQQAVQTAVGQQGVRASDYQRKLAAGQQYGNLGTGAQAAALQGAQAQIGAGTLEQQTQQADLTARYQEFLQERGYPFQVAQFLANIAMGTGALSGSTTTTTQPSGFFSSDRRLKKDIVRIGETDAGLPIYSYRYKGQDGPKQIGLMAQDVEKVNPDAVGLAAAADGNYYKTVNYEKATERPRKEYGGGLSGADENWMGGAVQPESRGLAFSAGGYAPGGAVDPNDIQALLAAQRQAFGPFGKSGLYGGPGAGAGAPGSGGIVPEAKLPVPRLMTAAGAPRAPRSGFEEAAQTGKSISDLYKTGKELRQGFTEMREALAGKAYGGAIGYADGGEIDPYELSNDPLGDVVKAGKSEIRELPKPGQPPGAPKSGLGEVADLAKGAASLYSLGSTVLPAAASGASSALAALAAFLPFSDERMKDNVDPVGETYDGQTIYRYNLGDGATQLGLMAQESRSDAVHKDGLGLLHLDYKKATEDAVPFAYGGLVPRQGYQVGGEIADYSAEADLPAIGAQEVAAEEDVNRVANALRSIESSNRYGVLGPVSPKSGDRAYGAYQVMGANIPSWSREALGREVSPREFLESRDIQDQVAKHRINKYLDQYGNPTDVASMWFSGRPASRAMGLSDFTGTSVPKYLQRFAKAYEGDLPAPGSRETGGERKFPLGEAAARKAGEYSGVPADKASFGDFAREYLPKGFPTNEKLWVPALGFLGSMLASKSPFLGGAIGEGLMGGVSAYTGLEKSAADVEKLKAEADKIRTEAQVQEFTQLYVPRWIQGYGWEVVDRRKPFDPPVRITDEKLKPIPGVDPRLGAIVKDLPVPTDGKTPATTGAGAAGGTGTQEPRLPNVGSPERPNVSSTIEKDITTWRPIVRAPEGFLPQGQYDIGVDPDVKKTALSEAKETLTEERRKAAAAYMQLMSLERMSRNIEALPETGFTRPGAYAKERKAFAEKANDLIGVIGGRPAFSPDELSRLEELSKDSFRLGSALANSIGTREPGFIVTQATAATPSITNTRQGYRLIASGLTEAARYEKDKASFIEDYAQRFQHIRGADELFARLNPYQKYAQRALANVADPVQANALREYLSREGVTEAQKRQAIQTFDAANGRGVANAILGLQ